MMGEMSVLVAEVTGAGPLAVKLGPAEAARAVDRALARAERSVQAYAGSRLPAEAGHLSAAFKRRGEQGHAQKNKKCSYYFGSSMVANSSVICSPRRSRKTKLFLLLKR